MTPEEEQQARDAGKGAAALVLTQAGLICLKVSSSVPKEEMPLYMAWPVILSPTWLMLLFCVYSYLSALFAGLIVWWDKKHR